MVGTGRGHASELAKRHKAHVAVALTVEEVTILAGGKGKPHGATTEEFVSYYRLRGTTANIIRFDARNAGKALLAKNRRDRGKPGAPRLILFDISGFLHVIGFLVLAIGVHGIGEMLWAIEQTRGEVTTTTPKMSFAGLVADVRTAIRRR